MFEYLQAIQYSFDWLRAMPWLVLLSFSIPFAIVAASKNIFPHVPLVLLLLVPCLLTFTLFIWPDLFLIIGAADAIILVAALFDLWTLPSKSTFTAERSTTRVASIAAPHRVNLVICNHSSRGFYLTRYRLTFS